MSRQGAAMQNYNNELVKYLEDLNTKRHDLAAAIAKEDEEKRRLEDEISSLQKQLEVVDANLTKKRKVKEDCDKVINETQMAYNKLLEGSQALLSVLKKESATLKMKLDTKQPENNAQT